MSEFNLGDYIPSLSDTFSYFLSDPLATRGLIIALKGSRKVPFDLELITDGVEADQESDELDCLEEHLRYRMSQRYPKLKLSEDLVLSGRYGGADRGPALQGETDIETFKEVFGEGVQLGVSCLLGRFVLPAQLHPQWYQVGRLHVPRNLNDLVKGVYLTKPETPHEIKLWVPGQAQKYPVVNELR